jgi:3-oxoacyl-[acyl-carrier protein] reductase
MIRAAGAKRTEDPGEAELRRQRRAAHFHFMPIKRLSTPEEQAAAILFLASRDAAYVNGVALDVNGGMYMA